MYVIYNINQQGDINNMQLYIFLSRLAERKKLAKT